LQQWLRRPAEGQAREITQQVHMLGVGAQVLRYASPPMAEAWCRMMLDARGGLLLSEPMLSEVLSRATGGAF